MEIVECFNGMFKVVNSFGQKIGTFSDYDSAFDFLCEIEGDTI